MFVYAHFIISNNIFLLYIFLSSQLWVGLFSFFLNLLWDLYRDESIARIQTLDQQIKKLRDQLAETEKSNNNAQAELGYLRSELEELAPYRDAALEQREMKAQESVKVKELSDQITKLEDTRDIQSAMIEELETKITTIEAEALEFKDKVHKERNFLGVLSLVTWL